MKKEEVFREQIIQGFVDNVQFGYDSKWSVPESGVGGVEVLGYVLAMCVPDSFHSLDLFPFPQM